MNKTLVPKFLALALLPIVVLLGDVHASDESTALYSRGLVPYHAERYTEALTFFEQAVNTDSSDASALYYRGVTRARLGQYEGAITDLRRVRELSPDMTQAALDLGIVLVESGQPAVAVAPLTAAQEVPELRAEASLFLGLAGLRMEQRGEAREQFSRAAVDPALEVPARYYQGVVAYQEERWSEAELHFEHVVNASPDTPMGEEAATLLSRLRSSAPRTARRYSLYANFAGQYDSNVALAPNDELLETEQGISDKSDWRSTYLAGGRYAPLLLGGDGWSTELSVGYEFFQSIHADLTEFDLQNHRPYLQFVANLSIVQLGLLGRYDYYFSGSMDSFLSQGTVSPWIGIAEGDIGRIEFFYRLRLRDFLQRPFDELRDGKNQSAGMRQTFFLDGPARALWVGYRYDYEDPDNTAGEPFGYNGHEASAGGRFGWSFGLSTEAGYVYRHEEYFKQSDGRRDDAHEVVFGIEQAIGKHFSIVAAYFGVFNRSSEAVFTYNRHVGSLGFEVRL